MTRILSLSSLCLMLGACAGEVVEPEVHSLALTGEACEAHVTTIFGGQTIDAGSVEITNTDTHLVITMATNVDAGWMMEGYHVFAGMGLPPTNNAGAPVPGHFPYVQSFDPAVDSYTLMIPLEDLLVGDYCGQMLTIAVHVELVRFVDGVPVQTETGWARGDHSFRRGWGSYFAYEICCPEDDAGMACTLTQGYWRNHYNGAPGSRDVAWPIPESTLMCSGSTETWFDIMSDTAVKGNAYLILAHQYIAARLNEASGADVPDDVAAALAEVAELLESYCGQFVGTSTQVGSRMVVLAELLDAYNNGDVGPGHCESEEAEENIE